MPSDEAIYVPPHAPPAPRTPPPIEASRGYEAPVDPWEEAEPRVAIADEFADTGVDMTEPRMEMAEPHTPARPPSPPAPAPAPLPASPFRP